LNTSDSIDNYTPNQCKYEGVGSILKSADGPLSRWLVRWWAVCV